MLGRLRNLVVLPCKYPLRTFFALLVLLPAAGWVGQYVWAGYQHRAALRDMERLNFASAETRLEACLRVWPADPHLHLLLARAERRRSALEDAERRSEALTDAAHHLDICRERGGENESLDLERKLLRIQQGNLAGLDSVFLERAQQDTTEAPLLLEALSQGYLATNDIRSALTSIQLLLESRPDHVQALFWHGQAMEYLDRDPEAAADYERAVEINPAEALPRKSLGAVLLKLNRSREALLHFEYVAEHVPEDPQARLGIACCLRGMGRNEEARPLIDGLLRAYPEEPRVLFEGGKLAQDAGQLAEAEQLFRRAYTLRPYEKTYIYGLCQCLGARGKQDEAKALLAKLERRENDRKQLLELTKNGVEKGWTAARRVAAGAVCLRLGMFENALAFFKLANQQDPKNVPALEGLAECYQKTAKPALAAEYRQRARLLKQSSASNASPEILSPAEANHAAATPADLEELLPRNPGYVGPQACASCHAERVAEFQRTRHFKACRLPEAGSMPSGFAPEHGTYVTRYPALRFEMTRTGTDYLQTAVRATGSGEQRSRARVDLVYGSGGSADEIYFTWRDDRLYELPMAWLHPAKCWGEQPFDPYGTGNFTRTTTPRCLECHNTWCAHVPGTENQYRRESFILGVTCERCHGPGREHVAFHQAHPNATQAHAVVHPGHLTRERQLDLCGQCHSNAPQRRGPAFSYRPGEPLEAYFRTNLDTHPEKDHVTNQVRYLRESKCFQKSDTLSCTTCHNPHRPSDSAVVQRSCMKCHQAKDCHEQERLPAAVRSNCVDCHMPRFTRIQVFFHTEDDQYLPPIRPHQHRIAVYPEAKDEVMLGWFRTQTDAHSQQEARRLTKALVDHWLSEAAQLRYQDRVLAAMGALREAVRLDPGPVTRDRLREVVAILAKLDADMFLAQHQFDTHQFALATETLHGILAVKRDSAKALGKLGTIYGMAGQFKLAVEHLLAAARYDPDDDYAYAMLGWLAYLEGKAEDAAKYYRHADDIGPYSAQTKYHLGLALLKLDKPADAGACFRQALSIDPRHTEACLNLSQVLRRQGQSAQALTFALRGVRLTHSQNPEMLLTLAECYADAGRFSDAEKTAAQAIEAAQQNKPELAPRIESRLDDFRARGKQSRNRQ